MELSTAQRRGRPEVFLLLSLLLHAALLLVVRLPALAPIREPRPLEVSLIERPRPPAPAPEKAPELPEKGQLVAVPIERPTETPPDTKFLAEKSQRVDQETWLPELKPSVRPAPGTSAKGQDAVKQAGEKAGAVAKAPAQTERPAAEAPPPAPAAESPAEDKAEERALRSYAEGEWLAPKPERDRAEASRAGSGKSPSLGDILPTGAQLARLEPRAGGNEYLPELPDGDRTRVNTREFKHYSYYVKLREKIALAWDFPREGAGRNGEVRLAIKINPNGTLADLRMVASSGFAPFDEEALEAVQMAAPFEPTPVEIREADGRLALVFTFHYIGGRIFRVK